MTLQIPPKLFDRVFRGRRSLRYAAYALCGALTALVFAPAGLYLLTPVLLLPLLLSCLWDTPRVAARNGFSFGAGLFFAGTYWIYISVHVFGQAPLWLAVFLMIVLVLLMATYYALVAAVIARWSAASPWRLLLVAPAAWVLMEWLRGWLFSGLPWLSLGYGQIDSVLAGWAPVVGVYGVSFVLMVSIAAIPAAWLLRGAQQRVALGLVLLPWIVGGLLSQAVWTTPSGEEITTSIIQGGVSQDKKWLPEQFRPTLDLYRKATQAQRNSKLIVWPEVALPTYADRVEPFLSLVEMGLRDRGASLVLGILERDHNSEHVYNSALLLNGGEIQSYRKRHLVPFGEYFPVPDSVREWMRLMSLPSSDMTPGDDSQPLLKTSDGYLLGVAICYEDAYGAEQLYALPDADILINLSNDAWFGDSIAPHQHLEIARMRALEAGRYSVRATNTGVSAFIAPDGGVMAVAPQFEMVVLTAAVTPMQGLTPYARTGNWPIILFALLLMMGSYRRTH